MARFGITRHHSINLKQFWQDLKFTFKAVYLQ